MNLKTAALILSTAALPFLAASAEERPAVYQFDVTVGGQPAEYKDAFPVFAKIPKPVAADAEVTLAIGAEQIIVNVFPCNPDGTVPDAAPAKIILVPEGTAFKLDATMDKTTLGPGLYGMNIAVGSKGTSRIMFTVGKEGDAPAAPAPVAEAGAVDQSTPESTVSVIFAAAKSGDLTPLLAITPAAGDIDGDVKRIRDAATAGPKIGAEFAGFFAEGRVDGAARIEGDRAEVDFFGPGGAKAETMNLVRKDGKWFLDSF